MDVKSQRFTWEIPILSEGVLMPGKRSRKIGLCLAPLVRLLSQLHKAQPHSGTSLSHARLPSLPISQPEQTQSAAEKGSEPIQPV